MQMYLITILFWDCHINFFTSMYTVSTFYDLRVLWSLYSGLGISLSYHFRSLLIL